MLRVPITVLEGGLVADTGRGLRDPGPGALIAHDIIDHPLVPHPDPVIDELMAIGGALARVGHFGLMARQVEYVKSKCSDLCPVGFEGERTEYDGMGLLVGVVGDKELAWEVSGWIGEGRRRWRERFPGVGQGQRVFEEISGRCDKFLRGRAEGERGVVKVEGGFVWVYLGLPRG